jgi:hypothetical protein
MRSAEPVTRRPITCRDPLKKEKRKKKKSIRRIDYARLAQRQFVRVSIASWITPRIPFIKSPPCSKVSWKISHTERTFRERDGRRSRRNFFGNIVHERGTLHPLSLGYRGFVRSCRLHGVRDTLTYWVTCRNWATHPYDHVWPIFVVVRFAAELVSIDSGSLQRWVRFDAARAADNNIRDRKPARWRAQTHVASSNALGKRKERLANDHRGRMIYGEKERVERAAN